MDSQGNREESLVERMRSTSSGWTCRPCLFDGRPHTRNAQGGPLSEADRCPGCAEIVCDRHILPDGLPREVKHAATAHGAAR